MSGSPIRVLAVMDGHRVTGPAKQLLAVAGHRHRTRVRTMLALFQRPPTPTPLVSAARRRRLPLVVVRDRFPADPRTAFALATHARASGVDVVQTHGYKANVLARLFARTLRKPWVAFLHGETSENWKVRAYYRLERLAVRGADRIVVVSEDMANRLIARGVSRSRVCVIRNACLHRAPAGVREAAAASGASMTVGVVGRLSPEKGIDVALKVHGLVASRCPEARLCIAGEGPERPRLERITERLGIGRSVEWLGYLDDPDSLYRRMAVLLLPSRSEGFPNVALEAMAHGVPVVASRVGGIPEIVLEGRSGFLVDSEDVGGMAERVVALLNDGSLRQRIGREAQFEVGSRFSVQARAEALATLYAEVLA
jgi:glycosyltransferase involved in cell wall biosynthesis